MNIDFSHYGNANPTALASEERILRDIVFEKPISDKEWDHCWENWVNDLPWLREQAAKKTKSAL
jgi:hypothetical protein